MVFFELMFFPIWIMVFVFLFVVFLFIFWIWAIIDCLRSNLSVPQKLLWLFVILFFHFIGALLYFIFSNRKGVTMKTINIKGKRLFRSKKNRMIAGVCAGIGEYLDIDPTVIRLLWVLITFFSGGAGVLAYIIAWIIIPEK